MISLKVLNAQKDNKWYEDVMSYYIPPYQKVFSATYEEDLNLYRLVNNDISGYQEQLNRLCNNMIDYGAVEEELLPYNKIRGKLERQVGEILLRGNNHKVMLLSAKAVRAKNEKFQENLRKNVQEDLAQALEKATAIMQNASPEELQQFIQSEQLRLTPKDINYKNFKSDLEIFKSQQLKYLYNTQSILSKKQKTYRDLNIVSKCFIWPKVINGQLECEVLNPLYCGWDKDNDEEWVQRGSYFWVYDEISLPSTLDRYKSELSNTQAEHLTNAMSYSGSDKDHTREYVFDNLNYYTQVDLRDYRDENSRDRLTYQGRHLTARNRGYTHHDKVKRLRLEFKAYKEVLFYEHTDDFGDTIKVMLDNNTNIIPSNAQRQEFKDASGAKNFKYIWTEGNQKHEVYMMWVPRRYQCTRLANDILVDCKEVEYQPDYMERPYHDFGLSVKGGVMNNLNSISLSPVQEALPIQMQIYAVKALMNKMIADYEGTVLAVDAAQVVSSLAANETDDPNDLTNNPIIKTGVIRKKTKQHIFNSAERSGGLINAQRGVGVQPMQIGQIAEILQAQQLINALDQELGVTIGVPPQREAQVAAPNSNVRDNQQQLQEAQIRTEYSIWWHDQLWGFVLDELMCGHDMILRKFFQNNPDKDHYYLEYIAPEGSSELIKVIPEHLDHTSIGLYLSNTQNDRLFRDVMSQKLLQNTLDPNTIDSFSGALKALSSNSSIEEIDRAIQLLAQQQRERMEQREELAKQNNLELAQKQQQIEKDKNDNELAKIQVKEGLIKEREIEKASITVLENQLANDVNQNNIDDDLELQREKTKVDKQMHDDKMKLEYEKLKVEKANKNQTKNS